MTKNTLAERIARPPTQTERVLAFIRSHPGCRALDIAHGLDPWCSNPRARISDLRKQGVVIDCEKGRFSVRERRPVDRIVTPVGNLGL